MTLVLDGKGPYCGGFKPKNRGQKGLRTIYHITYRLRLQLFVVFTPILGEMIPILTSIYFQRGWLKLPTR